MKTIKLVIIKVDDKSRFGLFFPYDNVLMSLVRKIPGATWSRASGCWHVAATQSNLNRINNELGKVSILDLKGLHCSADRKSPVKIWLHEPLSEPDRRNLFRLKSYMEYRRYSASTVKTYSMIIETFLRFADPGAVEMTLQNEVIRFTNEYIRAKGLSYSYQNQFINALKVFYREILKRPVEIENIARPRSEHRLPNVLSKEEVFRLLNVMRNLKHRAMLSLIYACGLRRGELLSLKPEHIDSKRMLLIIKMAKGKKDRIVPLPQKLLELLRSYYLEFRPKVWLFEGVVAGEKYDERSLQMVLKKAIYLSKIRKNVTLHWLRHSYATHLHESGVDIHMIQLMLGHKSTRTTEIYTHVSQKSIQRVRSPFEDL